METILSIGNYLQHIIKLTSNDLDVTIKNIDLITDEEVYDFVAVTNYNDSDEDDLEFDF